METSTQGCSEVPLREPGAGCVSCIRRKLKQANGLIIEQTLRATDAFAGKARECRHSEPLSNERNAAGRRVRSSLRA